jgi:predicted  nucleic acid-binding Zn-ribbon protein
MRPMTTHTHRSINPRTWCLAVLVLMASAGATGRLVAFTPRPQPQAVRADEVLPALLAEVKGLRAAMEQMASAGPHIQLLVARLQLEEGRINTMVHRLDGVRDSLTSAQRELDDLVDKQQRGEAALNGAGSVPDRDALTQMVARSKRQAADSRAQVARFTAEEAQLTQDVASEQARWTEVNQRLDELERALVKR